MEKVLAVPYKFIHHILNTIKMKKFFSKIKKKAKLFNKHKLKVKRNQLKNNSTEKTKPRNVCNRFDIINKMF